MDSGVGNVIVTDDLQVNGNDIADSTGTNRIGLGATTTLTNTTFTLSGTTTLNGLALTAINGGATGIDFTEFDVDAGTGSVTINDTANLGQLSVEGSVLDIDSLSFVGVGELITASGDLTLNPSDDVVFANGKVFSIGGNAGDVAYNAIGDSLTGATQVDSDDDLFVEGVFQATAIYQGEYLVCDSAGNNCPTAGSGGSKWNLSANAISPFNSTLDVLVGGTATSSAKFGFLNVAGGTPTASISANSGNNALFITGNGNLATTNMQNLTLGGATTGGVTLDSGVGRCV